MIKSIVSIGFKKNNEKKLAGILNKILPDAKIFTAKTLPELNFKTLEKNIILVIRYKKNEQIITSSSKNLLKFPAIIVSENPPNIIEEQMPQNLFIVDYIPLERWETELPLSIEKVENFIKNSEKFIQSIGNIENAKIEWERGIDSINDLILILDKNLTIKRINLAVANYAGKKFTDIIGKKCFSVLRNRKSPCEPCVFKSYLAHNSIPSPIKIDKKGIYRVEITPIFSEIKNSEFVLKLTDVSEEFFIKKFFFSILLMSKKSFVQESIQSLFKKFFFLLSKWSGFKRGIVIFNNGTTCYSFGYKKEERNFIKNIILTVVEQERVYKKLKENFYYILSQEEIDKSDNEKNPLAPKCIIFPVFIKEKIEGYIVLDTPFKKVWFNMAVQDGIKMGINTFAKIVNNAKLKNKIISQNRELDCLIENLKEGVVYLNKQKEVMHINSSGKAMMSDVIKDWDGVKVKKIGNLSINKLVKDALDKKNIPNETIGSNGRIYSILLAVVNNKGTRKRNGYMLTIRDITQNRLYAEDLMTTFQMASLGEITAEIAHEINNPLTAIVGFAELLSKEKTSPEIKRKLTIITEQGKRVASTVQALLMSSKKSDFGEFDLNQSIVRTLKLIKHPYYLKSIDVEFSPFKKAINCIGDANLIEVVLLNILKNAKEAIVLLKKKGKITIKTYKKGRYGVFTIKDNGPGIPAGMQNRVMDTFFSTKETRVNLGLGLSICKRIIDMHKGTINISSMAGKGTKFSVQIPLLKKKTSRLELFEKVDKKSKKNIEDILIIDDEEVILSVMEDMFRNYGYKVDTTTSPTEGIKKIKQKKYGIIFLDIRMPEMDGRDVYYKIMKDAPNNVNKVVFFTGDTLSTDIQRFLKEVKAPYLKKPFTEKEIMQLLEENSEKSS